MPDNLPPADAPPPASPPPPPILLPPAGGGGGGGAGLKQPLFLLLALALIAVPAYGMFEWFFCRIEVEQGRIAVLVAKTGRDLPSGQILAGDGEKGIRLETLAEGRHFRNPLFWDWIDQPIAEVPSGHIGVVTRLFGTEPGGGRILVDGGIEVEDVANAEKGILREVLRPGRYRVNPFAYTLDVHKAIDVPPGHVGVVTNLVGTTPKKRNQYVVEPGERGIQRTTFGPGVHYVNPYELSVLPLDVRQRRLEFAIDPAALAKLPRNDSRWVDWNDHVAVVFPSADGFEITVKLTVTWQVSPERAAETLARISSRGDLKRFDIDVIHRVITPALRGFARIEGSKFKAVEYIAGESRSTFQRALLEKVKATCGPKGIIIHDMLVSDIEPPSEIADPIRQREIAREELTRNQNQIRQAKAEQTLARQTELVKQERARVESETKKLQQEIASTNRKEMAEIEQEKLLLVARTDLVAAELQAAAMLSRGKAEADVVRADNIAATEPLRRSIEAFQSPRGYAGYTLVQRLAPTVKTVFADPASEFGRILSELLNPDVGARVPRAPAPAERED